MTDDDKDDLLACLNDLATVATVINDARLIDESLMHLLVAPCETLESVMDFIKQMLKGSIEPVEHKWVHGYWRAETRWRLTNGGKA